MRYLKISLLVTFFMMISQWGNAQLREGAPKTTKSYQSWTKEQCENHIEALNKKAEYIKSNPQEYKIAKEQGWFEKAEKTKNELKVRIEELEK